MNFEAVLTSANLLFMIKSAGMSLLIAVVALFFGTILGILGSAAKLSKNIFLKAIGNLYVELIRGTPMLLQIMFFYLAVPQIFRLITGNVMRPNVYVVGIIAISINSGAYSTELIRSGIMGIDKGQWEASKTLGLSYFQTMRFVILPQAFKQIIPPLVSEFITLIKDSSLISVIGAVELMQSAQIVGTQTFSYVASLSVAGVFYLIMTLTVSYLATRLERRLAESD